MIVSRYVGEPAVTSSSPLLDLPLVRLLWPKLTLLRRWNSSASNFDGTYTSLGWGMKPSGLYARKLLTEGKVKTAILLEDGFLRSVDREGIPLSMVMDDLGIYYDARSESRLECLIKTQRGHDEIKRAHRLIDLWRSAAISKYNANLEYQAELADSYVLVVDQVANDSSIRFGGANAESFQTMLARALEDNPSSSVVLKVHPDAVTRKAAGHFDLGEIGLNPRVKIISDACHPVRLIQNAEAVYVVTSQMGFEALIHDKPVHCFGSPFYAGWGLTQDYDFPAEAAQRRAVGVTIAQLVYAALIDYSCYLNPETGQLATPEVAIKHLAFQRRSRSRFSGSLIAVGISPWKRPFLKRFLAGADLSFARSFRSIPQGADVVVWGSKALPGDSHMGRVIRVEDGFIRSRGLGAELTEPMSWVLDDCGMYYDATRVSRLEMILSKHDFSNELLQRADALADQVRRKKISKYNLAAEPWRRPDNGQKVILVPGQVANDASIQYGAIGEVKTNETLLATVRVSNSDAWVVYKPHPDVVASLRAGKLDVEALEANCDEVLLQGDAAQLLDEVDEVHTLTSLMGFEALLRGCKVTCYGAPFYSGWGLTEDKVVVERRQRRLSLSELVAGTLILYPDYIHPRSGEFSQAENIVDYLANAGISKKSRWRWLFNKYVYWRITLLGR